MAFREGAQVSKKYEREQSSSIVSIDSEAPIWPQLRKRAAKKARKQEDVGQSEADDSSASHVPKTADKRVWNSATLKTLTYSLDLARGS